MKPDEPEPYRVMTPRRRVLVALLAVATAVLGVLSLTRHARWHTEPPPPPCVEDETTRCVGGKADVILIPASPAEPASAASAP
jgi:hypothetical protein